MRTLLRSVSEDLTELRRAPATGGDVDMGRWRFLYGFKFWPMDETHPGLNQTVEGAIA